MAEVSLTFIKVAVTFGNRLVINLDHLHVASRAGGRIIAIMGPSGSGKTTLGRLALGLQSPSEGTIQRTPMKLKTAYVPQKPVLFPDLTVSENVSCLSHSTSLGASFRPDSVASAMHRMGLSWALSPNIYVDQLSGGEGQRLMLARLLTVDFDLLVLDEPCAALDNFGKSQFLEYLTTIVRDRGCLCLFITHSWSEARRTADECIFLHPSDDGPQCSCISVNDAEDAPPFSSSVWIIHWPFIQPVAIDDLRHLNPPPTAVEAFIHPLRQSMPIETSIPPTTSSPQNTRPEGHGDSAVSFYDILGKRVGGGALKSYGKTR